MPAVEPMVVKLTADTSGIDEALTRLDIKLNLLIQKLERVRDLKAELTDA